MKDYLAVLVSAGCLIHCMLTPLIIGLGTLGVAGQWLGAEWIHKMLLIPVILLALLSLPTSYRIHRQHLPLAMAMLGIAAMLSTLFLPEALETWITVPAATLVILAHAWNRTLTTHFQQLSGEVSDG